MRPRKPVLICGNDADRVGEIAYMLGLQAHYNPIQCNRNGLREAIKAHFFFGVILLERPGENLSSVAAIVAEKHNLPALIVKPECSAAELRDHVAQLMVRARGPRPRVPKIPPIATAPISPKWAKVWERSA
jgi:hypothetical protein